MCRAALFSAIFLLAACGEVTMPDTAGGETGTDARGGLDSVQAVGPCSGDLYLVYVDSFRYLAPNIGQQGVQQGIWMFIGNDGGASASLADLQITQPTAGGFTAYASIPSNAYELTIQPQSAAGVLVEANMPVIVPLLTLPIPVEQANSLILLTLGDFPSEPIASPVEVSMQVGLAGQMADMAFTVTTESTPGQGAYLDYQSAKIACFY